MKIRQLIWIISFVFVSAALHSCEEKQELVIPEEAEDDIVFNVNGVSFKMVKIEGSIFRMGSDGVLFEVVENETPSHNVSLSDYYIGETEVTQELWVAVMGNNPSAQNHAESNTCPVENVSWDDCQMFIDSLNAITGRVFSLPTEAQWEYAARDGIKLSEYLFSGSDNIQKVCWYSGNTPSSRSVKGKEPNKIGLYDMSGNVAEWCNDWYGMYSGSFQEDPIGHHSGTKRVIRGGGWTSSEKDCRNTARDCQTPDFKNSSLGFRLALSNKTSVEEK